MPKKLKNKARLDKFYHIAKEAGYRSRAAFKLIQLNKKYNFLSKANVLIDLCAAPGGWLQVAESYMPFNSIKIGVDLDPIKPVPNCKTFISDITSQQCVSLIKKEIGAGGKADVVLNDGAPNVGASWVKDAFSQTELVLAAFKLATQFLRKGGIFVTKVFRSNDYNSLMWVLQKFFEHVEATKPEASRQQSAEIFVIGQNYLAPDYIDKKFFDSKFVFKDTENDIMETYHSKEVQSLQDILRRKKNRTGYAENVPQHLFQTISFGKFVRSQNPFAILYDFNNISVSEEEKKEFMEKVQPPEEWESMLSDLKVLGKRELAIILKWRSKILFKMNLLKTKEEKANQENQEEIKEVVEEKEADTDDELEKEIQNQQALTLKLQKKDEKKKVKAFAQQNSIVTVGDENQMNIEDEDQELFEFSKIRNAQRLGYVDLDQIEEEKRKEMEIEKQNRPRFTNKDKEEIDDNLELNYQQKLEKRQRAMEIQKQNKLAKNKKKRGIVTEVDEDQLKCEQLNLNNNDKTTKFSNLNELEELEDVKQKLKKRWFDQDIFKDMQEDLQFSELRKEQLESKGQHEVKKQIKEIEQSEKPKKKVKKEQENQDDQDDMRIVKLKSDMEKRRDSLKRVKKKQEKKQKEDDTNTEIEFVKPDFSDPDGIATRLALAKKMLRKKKREYIIDSTLTSAHTYACDWEDSELNLPEWFIEDERKHWFKTPPVTKEEVEVERARLQQLNSYTPKKVMEAKIRKQKRVQRMMKKGSQLAQTVLQTEGLSEAQKIEKAKAVIRKAVSQSKKHDKKVIVVRQGGTDKVKQGRNVKCVDKRMKLDKKREKMKQFGKFKKHSPARSMKKSRRTRR